VVLSLICFHTFDARYDNRIFSLIAEFYEEALSLLYELTCKEITPDLWAVLEILYEVIMKCANGIRMNLCVQHEVAYIT